MKGFNYEVEFSDNEPHLEAQAREVMVNRKMS